MNWTTEYPKEAGFYWVRNMMCRAAQWRPDPTPVIVKLVYSDLLKPDSPLDVYFAGDEVPTWPKQIISAEWQGPLRPPD